MTVSPNSRIIDTGLLLIALAVLTAGAMHFAWVNDDAQNYLTLATRLSEGHLPALRPSWGDPYWAVFPAGYPALIAPFIWLTGDALIASKLAGACLLFGSVLLFTRWLRLPMLLAASVFTSLWMLEINSYSWSENAFIFALALSSSSLSRYLEQGRLYRLGLYLLGLLLLASSRYIGGVLLVVYLLAPLVYLRHSPHKRLLLASLATCFAGALFGLYLLINRELTGFPTGMQRTPAPESITELLMRFVLTTGEGLSLLLPPCLLAWWIRTKPSTHAPLPASAKLLLSLAAAYAATIFALRAQARFENFSGRILAPGMLLATFALLNILTRRFPPAPTRSTQLRLAFLLLFTLNIGLLYRDLLAHPERAEQGREHAQAVYEKKYGALQDGTVIISAGYLDPTIGWRYISPLLGSDRLFYAIADDQVIPFADYKAYLLRLRYKKQKPPAYLFDFTEFKTIADFDAMLKDRNTDPAFIAWMRPHFKPSAFVPCPDC